MGIQEGFNFGFLQEEGRIRSQRRKKGRKEPEGLTHPKKNAEDIFP